MYTRSPSRTKSSARQSWQLDWGLIWWQNTARRIRSSRWRWWPHRPRMGWWMDCTRLGKWTPSFWRWRRRYGWLEVQTSEHVKVVVISLESGAFKSVLQAFKSYFRTHNSIKLLFGIMWIQNNLPEAIHTSGWGHVTAFQKLGFQLRHATFQGIISHPT